MARAARLVQSRTFKNQRWYPWTDSNRHALLHQILNLTCLPFHHTGMAAQLHQIAIATQDENFDFSQLKSVLCFGVWDGLKTEFVVTPLRGYSRVRFAGAIDFENGSGSKF